MKNLNAEKVKRGLECCANNDECIGEACPYYTTGCEKNMPKDALALIISQEQRIKELAEENERLAKHNAVLIEDNHILATEFKGITIVDTVREMQERLKAVSYQSSDWSHGEHPMVVEVEDIDQIAKEMLEGE